MMKTGFLIILLISAFLDASRVPKRSAESVESSSKSARRVARRTEPGFDGSPTSELDNSGSASLDLYQSRTSYDAIAEAIQPPLSDQAGPEDFYVTSDENGTHFEFELLNYEMPKRRTTDSFDENISQIAAPKQNNDIWNLQNESVLSFDDIEYQQFKAAHCVDGFSRFLTTPAGNQVSTLPNSRLYAFDADWPETNRKFSELSTRFQMYAIRLLAMNGDSMVFRKLLTNHLIDLTRPIKSISDNCLRSLLSFAVERRTIDLPKIEILLEFMSIEMINRPNSDGYPPLEMACRAGNLPLVRKLVEAGADMNAKLGSTGMTAFARSATRKQTEIVDYFMETGKADVSLVFVDKSVVFTIVIMALGPKYIEKMFKLCTIEQEFFYRYIHVLKKKTADNPSIFRMMLQKAKAFGTEKIQYTLACLARDIAVLNDLESLKYLHSLNVPLDGIYPHNQNSKYSKMKLIHYIAIKGHIDILNFLVDTVGANVNDASGNGFIPLTFAWNNGKFDMVRELIKRGSRLDLNIQHIEYCIIHNLIPIIDAILLSPIDIGSLKLSNGHNLVTYAATMDRSVILSKLIQSGRFDLTAPDGLGQTLLTMKLPITTSNTTINIILESENDLLVDLLTEKHS